MARCAIEQLADFSRALRSFGSVKTDFVVLSVDSVESLIFSHDALPA